MNTKVIIWCLKELSRLVEEQKCRIICHDNNNLEITSSYSFSPSKRGTTCTKLIFYRYYLNPQQQKELLFLSRMQWRMFLHLWIKIIVLPSKSFIWVSSKYLGSGWFYQKTKATLFYQTTRDTTIQRMTIRRILIERHFWLHCWLSDFIK